MKKNIIVVGSGISGLSIAKMLREHYQVQILERSEEIGGLIKCKRINDNLFHLVGGHVFNSRNQIVLDWFWQFFHRDTEFVKAARNAKILLNNTLIGYPIENYLYQLPDDIIKLICKELLSIAVSDEQAKNSDHFEGFLLKSFGPTLFDIYFGPYNRKIWNTDLSKVPLEWLDDKLPMPKIGEIFYNNITQTKDSATVHASFFYPVNGGSQFIINRLAEGTSITTSYHVESIAYANGQLSVNNNAFQSDALVYCGDVRQLHKIVQISDNHLKASLDSLSSLLSNGTTNVLCECDDGDISWLYLPEEKFKAHRIIYTGNFSEFNNRLGGRKTCVVEFSGKQDRELILAELAVLPGNLQPIAFNYEPNSYIIQHKDTRDKINLAKKLLEKFQIYLLGRFSEWEYYNMDKCIESAMSVKEKIQHQITTFA